MIVVHLAEFSVKLVWLLHIFPHWKMGPFGPSLFLFFFGKLLFSSVFKPFPTEFFCQKRHKNTDFLFAHLILRFLKQLKELLKGILLRYKQNIFLKTCRRLASLHCTTGGALTFQIQSSFYFCLVDRAQKAVRNSWTEEPCSLKFKR